MTVRHYDVIVLGRSLGALATAALLARRDFRVLLLGQGQRGQTYHFDERALCRRTFTLLGGSSPAFRRILQELAHSPQFRRHAQPLDPMFAWLGEGRRMEVPPDMELFAREVDREFPEVRQLVDELYANIAQVNAAADAAFERDAVWPPGSLWERFETGRAAALLPFVRGERQHDLLGKFPGGHPFRELSIVPALFATNLAISAEQLAPFALARLHGAWTRGIQMLPGGEDELTDFLVERIEAHGGVCEFDRKASAIVVRRGVAVGVMEDGEDEPTGSGAVVSDQFGEALADLAGGEGITKAAQQDWPRLSAEAGRFVVSVRLRREGLPAALAQEAFVLPAQKGRRDPRHPVVHLQRRDPPSGDAAGQESLVVAEAILPARSSLTLLEAREAILSTLRENLPFLDRHLLIVDSPHDGLPLFDYSLGSRREIERLHLKNALAGAEPMERLWTIDPPGRLDFAGEPVRGPIPNTYLVGKTVLPGLGQEGELLAAWSVARLITKRDNTRQRMRRQMWSKIETT